MLDPARWDELRGLTLSARTLVEGALPGHHAAVRTGVGGDFHDYRPYVPGDDPARIDWKVFGRSDRLYVRRHRRESELTAHLLVDASASMDFAGLGRDARPISGDQTPTKLRYALDLAMALALICVRQGDRAGAAAFDATSHHEVAPAATWPHLHHMARVLGDVAAAGNEANPAAALHALAQRSRGRALAVVISDFLDEPARFFAGADRWRDAGGELVALGVLTPTELGIDHLDRPLRLIEPETRRAVSTHGARVGEGYRRRLHAHFDHLRGGCAARGVRHHLIRTDEPVPAVLRRLLGADH